MIVAERKPPVSRKPETVTQRILDAAEAEFMASGYEGASTNRMVALFGGSKATLFRHFPTKQALLGQVVRRIAARWEQQVQTQDLSSAEPQAWLSAFATRVLEWILGEDTLFVGRLGIAEGHKLPELAGVFHASAGAPLQAMLADQLAQWHAAGQIDSADPEGDAQRFFDLAIAGAVSRALYGAERLHGETLEAHADAAATLFLRGRLPRSA